MTVTTTVVKDCEGGSFYKDPAAPPGGASQDWHDALVFHPKYHTLAISKINAPVILVSHTFLVCGLAHPSVRNYRVIHLRLCLILPLPVSCTIGNMKDAWEWCYSSIVRHVASPSCQLPKHLVHKTYCPIPFHLSASGFLSIDDRDQGLLSAYILTPTYSFSKLALYHILLLDN